MNTNISLDTRRKKTLKELEQTVGLIMKSLDDFIAKGSGNKSLRRTLEAVKPGLMKRSSNYIELMRNLDDVEIARSLQKESAALISLALAIGAMLGSRKMSIQVSNKIREKLKENTSNARRVALENRSPITAQKRNITIDAAKLYLSNHSNERPATINALMVQIRSDIEKKCKTSEISAPSQTSMWQYLKDANLL
jgi:hypothetical protein